jgi:arylformamidase
VTAGLDPYPDAQYNARASVPDVDAYAKLYRTLSDEAYVAAPHREVAYGPGDGELHDVIPQSGAGAPVFVFIHGGYWRAMSKEESALTALMLHGAGAVVVTLDYALAPAVTLTHGLGGVAREETRTIRAGP